MGDNMYFGSREYKISILSILIFTESVIGMQSKDDQIKPTRLANSAEATATQPRQLGKTQRILNWFENKSRPIMTRISSSVVWTKTCDWLGEKAHNVVGSCPYYFSENSIIPASTGSFLEVSLITVNDKD